MHTQTENSISSKREIPITRVNANDISPLPNMREIWQYREMLYFLVARDIKIRYKQTLLGGLWAILQPFFTMVVFSVFFGNVAKIPSNNIPYPIFSFAALVPWTFFANGVALGADSIVGQAHLVRKIYFPRILIPLARVLGGMIDFLLALVMLIAMMLCYGYLPSLSTLVLIPAFTLLLTVITLSLALWLSALNVNYRDVRYLVPFLVQMLLFATPIIYPSSLLGKTTRILYGVNPLVNIVDGFRWVLLNTAPPPLLSFGISIAVSLILLFSGLLFFSRAEGTFTDMV